MPYEPVLLGVGVVFNIVTTSGNELEHCLQGAVSLLRSSWPLASGRGLLGRQGHKRLSLLPAIRAGLVLFLPVTDVKDTSSLK